MIKLTPVAAAVTATYLFAASQCLGSFVVTKNVNAPAGNQEEIILFDKSAGINHLVLDANGEEYTMEIDGNGDFVLHIENRQKVQPALKWKATSGLPETIDASDYLYIDIRGQLQGKLYRTLNNGRVIEQDPDNPWFITLLLDESGAHSSGINFAVISEDKKTPREMTDIKLPMSLYTQAAYNDTSKINAIAFRMPGGGTNKRDYTFTVERIALVK